MTSSLKNHRRNIQKSSPPNRYDFLPNKNAFTCVCYMFDNTKVKTKTIILDWNVMSDAEEEVKTHPCDKYKIPDCPGMIQKLRVETSAGYFSNLNENHNFSSKVIHECFWNHYKSRKWILLSSVGSKSSHLRLFQSRSNTMVIVVYHWNTLNIYQMHFAIKPLR